MTNKYRPHLHVLPEDTANKNIALGFRLALGMTERAMQILPVAEGKAEVLKKFNGAHAAAMRFYSGRYMVLLLDFDNVNAIKVRGDIRSQIEQDLQSRVFILGTKENPEALRASLRAEMEKNTLEAIGQRLAENCLESKTVAWEHPMLAHNGGELAKMKNSVIPFLFPNPN